MAAWISLMRGSRFFIVLIAALVLAGCARQQQPAYYTVDPATGQMVAVMQQQPVVMQYQPPVQAAPPAQVMAQQPQANGRRGLFTQQRYAAPPATYAQPYGQGGPYAAPPQYGYASASPYEPAYALDSGDRLRIVVFGQDGISNSYTVDAGGNVNLPLVGMVPARGASTQHLAQLIASKLKQGYMREPHVTVEVESYRPFFILGEVTNPGQYPYVANMTVETAVAIAGGFAPRASKRNVEVTRNTGPQRFHGKVPLNYPLRPGDTIVVQERWF